LNLDPKDGGAWINQGNALYGLEKYEQSLEAYEEALKLDIRNIKAWKYKGSAMGHLGKHTEALEAFEEALQLDSKDDGAWKYKGDALYCLGKYTEALEAFEEALQLDPKNAIVLYKLACVYSKVQKTDLCLDYLKQAIIIDEKLKKECIKDPDFDNVRMDPRFKSLIDI